MTPLRKGAVILCGGDSRRMGRDKATLPFGDGLTILDAVLCAVRAALPESPIVCVAAPEQPLVELPPGVRRVDDRIAGRGPLEAFATGLAAIADDADVVFAIGCDAPLLKSEVVSMLTEPNPAHTARVVVSGGRLQPLLAAYPSAVLPFAEAALAAGKQSLMALLDLIEVEEVDDSDLQRVDPDLDSLLNCNTPESYQQALTIAAESC